jgi:hypothetical protein
MQLVTKSAAAQPLQALDYSSSDVLAIGRTVLGIS